MTRLPDPRERPWLTVAEVAKITGEGEKVIRSAINAGQISSCRIGRYVRVPTALLFAQVGLTCDEGVVETPSIATLDTAGANREASP